MLGLVCVVVTCCVCVHGGFSNSPFYVPATKQNNARKQESKNPAASTNKFAFKMQQLQVINDNPVVNMISLVILSCLAGSILIVSFVLCGDIYGAGPAFVAVTGAFALCAFSGHLWSVNPSYPPVVCFARSCSQHCVVCCCRGLHFRPWSIAVVGCVAAC